MRPIIHDGKYQAGDYGSDGRLGVYSRVWPIAQGTEPLNPMHGRAFTCRYVRPQFPSKAPELSSSERVSCRRTGAGSDCCDRKDLARTQHTCLVLFSSGPSEKEKILQFSLVVTPVAVRLHVRSCQQKEKKLCTCAHTGRVARVCD
jgi:hypothetical protein